ncbi:MAG TPA: hypothetical protein V6C97_14090 [Oculatellaceae cyanobacterium]
MSQKDTNPKGKGSGSPSGKRSTKYRMQAVDESGKTTGDLTEQVKQVQAVVKANEQRQGNEEEGDSVRGLWKSKVLASYHGSQTAPAAKGDQDIVEEIHEAMIAIIDSVFDIFQNSAYEFNKIATGSELELNWVRPFLTKEGAPSWMGSNVEPVTVFTGRMSTRLWTLIMKGTTDTIQTYILPTSKLMTFNISSGTFKPFLVMEPYHDNGNLGWRIDDHEISPQLLQPIARELFNALIRFAKSEGREDEEFDLVAIGLVAPKPVEDPQVEIERQRYYQQAFLDDLKSHLETRRDVRGQDPREANVERNGPPPTEFNQPLPDHIRRELEVLKDSAPTPSVAPSAVPGGGFQSSGSAWKTVAENADEKLDANISRKLQMMAEEATSGAGGVPSPGPNPFAQLPQKTVVASQLLQQTNPPPPPPQAPSAQPVQQGVPLPPRQPQQGVSSTIPPMSQAQRVPAPQQAAPPPSADQLAQAMAAAQNAANAARPAQPMNLPAALSQLIASLDREMEVVAKAGADAFALRDLGRADAALKFSSRLSEYRQMSQELLDYYRRKR